MIVTKPHQDRIQQNGRDKGYSIRVGKNVPPNSANLAYVYSAPMNPKDNLKLLDLSMNIPENGIPSFYEEEKLLYPDDTFLLRDIHGQYKIPSRRFALTDEFSIPSTTQETPMPLYYQARAKGWFDASGAPVVPYEGGYVSHPIENPTPYSSLTYEQRENLLYLGDKIRITYYDGTPLKKDQKYKIHLVRQEGEGVPPNAYSIIIYTNFRSTKEETFVIRYEKYEADGSHVSDTVEILNAYPFFKEVSYSAMKSLSEAPKTVDGWKPELNNKEYAIVEAEDNTYRVYAPSQVLIANTTTRPPQTFQYRVKADLKTRLNQDNPGTLRIGMAYLNDSVYGVENLAGVMKKIDESSLLPKYLTLVNPHPKESWMVKESGDPRYWLIDLSMPTDYWNDYDVIILTGYGFFDLSPYSDSIRTFLQNGGKLWVDNAGSGAQVLTFEDTAPKRQTFVTSIGFSSTVNETGLKGVGNGKDRNEHLERLYVLESVISDLGYSQIAPRITFGSGESLSNWQIIVKYPNGNPSVIRRTMYGAGVLLVSNCGIFRALYHTEDVDMKFVINTLLSFAERKWMVSPWKQDYVYHRDNLFEEEYTSADGRPLYIDDRSDIDATQIVAKKIIHQQTKEALLPYMSKEFYGATGTYTVEVRANQTVPMVNNDLETGTYDEANETPITTWTQSTTQAIPGWGVAHVAGSTPEFRHIDSVSMRGLKAIQITAPDDGVGSQAYWYTKTPVLVGGTYRATVWVKAQDVVPVTGQGMKVGVYKTSGTLIAASAPITGTRDWVKVEVVFSLTQSQQVEIRLGFIDGKGQGVVIIDSLSVEAIGSVYMTPPNDGTKTLYAYATKPQGEAFNLKRDGFTTADVTTYDPPITIAFTIQAYTYVWNNETERYEKIRGNYQTYTRTIRRSDGIVNLGSLTTLIPALNSGSIWADRTKVYYEVVPGEVSGPDIQSKLVNLEIYNADTGEYYYNKDGQLVIVDTGEGGLFNNGRNDRIYLQAKTNYYTIRAMKRRYGLRIDKSERISLSLPATIDDRDCWYLRVRNGSFVKKEMSYDEIKQLLLYNDRYYQLQQRVYGTHYYSLPEYDRQVFDPWKGIQHVREEIAEYINDYTIRLQLTPLYVQQGESFEELLYRVDEEGKVFRGLYRYWRKDVIPRIWVDTNEDGIYTEWTDGYDIDYENGLVIFEQPVQGNVKASYAYNNLRLYKRSYRYQTVQKEVLVSSDGKTFVSSHTNWLAFPNPIIRLVPWGESEGKIVPPTAYTIDYESGVVTFKEEIKDRVIADYAYTTHTPIQIRDYDILNGLIYLDKPISFKDEIVADYFYEEQYVEYRGYYDPILGRFIHLDLNPSEGHYCTMPVVRYDAAANRSITTFEQIPTAKLMNKEIFIYLLPYKDSFGNRNEHTIRHCYSLEEWQKIQKTMPTALLLGVVQIREHTTVNDVVVMDARSRGGGLKPTITEEQIKKTQPLSMYYWDIGPWEGTAYYKNGVVIIELPKSILQSEGGQFTEKQVTDIIKKHIAYGIYYIVEFV